jgi:hypothetical protein
MRTIHVLPAALSLILLAGCAGPAGEATPTAKRRDDRYTVTGSNIPKRDSAGPKETRTMSREELERMETMNQGLKYGRPGE